MTGTLVEPGDFPLVMNRNPNGFAVSTTEAAAPTPAHDPIALPATDRGLASEPLLGSSEGIEGSPLRGETAPSWEIWRLVAPNVDDDIRMVMAKVSVWLHWLAALLALLLLLLPPTNLLLAAKITPLAVGAVAFSFFIYRFPWRRFSPRLFMVSSFLDVSLISLGVAVSGGAESRYSLLLFLVVVFASYFYKVKDAALVTGFTICIFCLPLIYTAHSSSWLVPIYASASGVMVLVAAVTKQTVLRVEDERARRDVLEEERTALYDEEVLRRRALQQKTRQLETILEMGNALRLQLGIDALLQRIASACAETAGFNVVVLRLFDSASGAAVCRAVHGEAWENVGLPTPPDLIESLMNSKFKISRSYLVELDPAELEDPSTRPYLLFGPDSNYGEGEWKATNTLIVPLETRDHGLIGFITIDEPLDGQIPSLDNIQTLEIFANLAATAIDNARLLQEASQVQALRELDRLKSDFLATISHDLRTPLTVIKGSVDLIETHADDMRAIDKQLIQGIGRNTQRLMGMVEQLLEMIQLQEGKTILNEQMTDLVELVRDTARSLEVAAGARSQTITVPGELGPIIVSLDRQRIQQVLANLIGNACKYGPDNQAIEVSLDDRDEEITVSVHDHGAPIRPEDRGRIFEKFYRSDQSIGKAGGTGLGLAICQSLVELHGGRIWIESQPGHGNTFRFSLPRVLKVT